MATSAVTTARIFASWRLRAVEVWSPAAAGGNAQASVEFLSDTAVFGARHVLIEDMTMGTARPAHVRCKPARDSVGGMWFSDAAVTPLFIVQAVTGGVIDIHLTVVLRNSEAAIAGPVPAGATTGDVYAIPLDGFGGFLLPVGWVNLP